MIDLGGRRFDSDIVMQILIYTLSLFTFCPSAAEVLWAGGEYSPCLVFNQKHDLLIEPRQRLFVRADQVHCRARDGEVS